MMRVILVLSLLVGPPAWAKRGKANLNRGERTRNQLPARPGLAGIVGEGETWDCVHSLGRKILDEAGRNDLALDDHAKSLWYPAAGTWYTIRASQMNGKSFDLEFRAKLDADTKTCHLQSDYATFGPIQAGGRYPDFVVLKESNGTNVLFMGVVPTSVNWEKFHYYCSGCP